MAKTTIKDIAERVGVSKSLVSMYLNHHPLSAHIAPSTKERIRRAVEETGYRPSVTARALKKGQSKTIGLIVGSITGVFYSYYASALLNEALKYDYQLLISLTRFNQEEEKRCLLNLMDRQTDGIIYHLHFHPDSRYRKLVAGYPLLLSASFTENPEYNSFLPDLRVAFHESFAHLAQAHCRRLVGFELGIGYWGSLAEEVGRQYGIEVLELNRTSQSEEAFYGEVLALEPDAVLTSSSNSALAFLRYCKGEGVVSIPRLIYSYTLPNDLLRHEAVYGALVNDFKQMVSGVMKRIVDMIEHPEEEVRNLHFPCHFMTSRQLSDYAGEQMEDLQFKTILSERDKTI